MKTKNFPGRKNQRRISALKRLKQQKKGASEEKQKQIDKEIEILESKIVDQEHARSKRTKKDRS